jgi:hypothetical protein
VVDVELLLDAAKAMLTFSEHVRTFFKMLRPSGEIQRGPAVHKAVEALLHKLAGLQVHIHQSVIWHLLAALTLHHGVLQQALDYAFNLDSFKIMSHTIDSSTLSAALADHVILALVADERLVHQPDAN